MNDRINRRARALIREAMNLGAEKAFAGANNDVGDTLEYVEKQRKKLVARVDTLLRNQK